MERLQYTVRRFLPLLVVLVLILGALWFVRGGAWFGNRHAGPRDNAAMVAASSAGPDAQRNGPPAPAAGSDAQQDGPGAPPAGPEAPRPPRDHAHRAQRGPADGPANGPVNGPAAGDRGPAGSWLSWLLGIPGRLFWWAIGTPAQWLCFVLIAAAVLMINRRPITSPVTTPSPATTSDPDEPTNV